MNILTGLYFPETAPDHTTLKRLLVFFDEITCLRSVEDEPPSYETLHQAGLIKELCPAPLGNGRDNFLKFIKDVKQYGPEYLEGSLASLSMKAMGDSDEGSIWSLVASIKKSPQNKQVNNTTQNLWRARFILKLEEIHAREERELLQALHNATAKKNEILNTLKAGDEITDLSELDHSIAGEPLSGKTPHLDATFSSQRIIQEEQLISAWAELFSRYSMEDLSWIAVTGYKDAAALLIDTCATENESIALGSISLPTLDHLHDEGYISERDMLQQKLKQNKKNISKAIQKAATEKITQGVQQQLQTLFNKEGKSWEETLMKSNAGLKTTTEKLDFYLFPGVSQQELFNRFAKTKHEKNTKEKQSAQNSILAVLSQ